jgi:putative transposase
MAYWKLYYHLVWSTKNRQPFITPQIEPHLYRFLVSRAAEMGIFVYPVNGMAEHVHVVAAVPQSQTTNHWLEHTTQFDEGPSELGSNSEKIIRESGTVYETDYGTVPL